MYIGIKAIPRLFCSAFSFSPVFHFHLTSKLLVTWVLRGYQVPHKMLSPPYKVIRPSQKFWITPPLKDCNFIFMWQSKVVSYFNICENIVPYLFKFITTPYQFKDFSHRLFFSSCTLLVWTKFVMLNNLITHLFRLEKFRLWNLYIFRRDVKSKQLPPPSPMEMCIFNNSVC